MSQAQGQSYHACSQLVGLSCFWIPRRSWSGGCTRKCRCLGYHQSWVCHHLLTWCSATRVWKASLRVEVVDVIAPADFITFCYSCWSCSQKIRLLHSSTKLYCHLVRLSQALSESSLVASQEFIPCSTFGTGLLSFHCHPACFALQSWIHSRLERWSKYLSS